MATPAPPRVRSGLPRRVRSDLVPYDECHDERLVDTDLTGDVEIAGCELRGVRITGADLERLRLVDVVLVDCELSGATLYESSLVRVELRNCRAAGLVIAQAQLTDVVFLECKLDDANLRFVRAERVRFDDCSLVGADCYEATCAATSFSNCDLTNAEFSNATMVGVRLEGSRLDTVRGASSLAGAIVTTDQVLPLALGVFADLGIVVDRSIEDRE